MVTSTSAAGLTPPRSALGRLVALELAIAVAFILGFAFFLFDRLDYVLERRDRQIVTRELDRIAHWNDVAKVRGILADLKKSDRRIAPDIIYAFVGKLSECLPSVPLNRCAEAMLWVSEEVEQETIDFAGLRGPKLESDEVQPELDRPSGPTALHRTIEFLTNRVYYQARRIGADGLLLVGIDRTEVLKEGRALLLRSTILFAAFVTIAIFLATWFITRLKQRITDINATLERVGSGSLQQRITLAGTNDEIDTLGRHTNSMLDRLDDLITCLQRFTDRVAHELRTPLTRVKSRLENVNVQNRPELSAPIRASLRDLDETIALFGDILELARLETNRRDEAEKLDLKDVVSDVVELFSPLIEDRGQTLLTDLKPVVVRARRSLLQRVIANLIDNATKYSGAKATIRVRCGFEDGQGVLEVQDNGRGLAADEWERVLGLGERGLSAGTTPGTGLGLHFARSVAEKFDMKLRFEDARPGVRVRLMFSRAEGTQQR